MNELPLLTDVSSLYPKSDFSRTLIIACQHLLGTQINLFEELFQKGLRPENTYLIGKNYSTNDAVYKEFLAKGVNVSPDSQTYDSHLSFDVQFQLFVERFLDLIKEKVNFADFDRVIVVDEGGHLLLSLNKFGNLSSVVGIEQTSSGYEKIKAKRFSHPVINVARSRAKLEIEAPLIANLVVNQISEYLDKVDIGNPKVLAVGQGAVGQLVKEQLGKHYDVRGFDIETHKSDLQGEYRQHLAEFNVIIGATGQSILLQEDFQLLKTPTHLISISSSDREFSAVELRKRIPQSTNIHDTLHINGLALVNGGFPINFDGARQSLPPNEAQLTVSLMLAAIYEANDGVLEDGLIELDLSLQKKIATHYAALEPQNVPPTFL